MKTQWLKENARGIAVSIALMIYVAVTYQSRVALESENQALKRNNEALLQNNNNLQKRPKFVPYCPVPVPDAFSEKELQKLKRADEDTGGLVGKLEKRCLVYRTCIDEYNKFVHGLNKEIGNTSQKKGASE